MKNRYYKKFIRIPPNEGIDIREVMPVIDHPLFQRLLRISQLGTTLAIFPGASHNRFEHALGVYGKTSLFCDRMVKEGFMTAYEARNVSLFALLHDIGHGPFSHVIEALTPQSGDENETGLKGLAMMKDVVKKSGGDFEFIKKLFSHASPLHKIVMDKNLGMDKLDYLERDTYHLGFGQRPDIKSVFDYLSFIKGRLVVDKKSLESAKQIQKLYVYMYKEVYLHKSSLIASRFLQKMVKIWLELEKVDPSGLWLMNDSELLAKIYTHSDKRLQFLYKGFTARNLPSTGLVFRLKDGEFKERIAGKKIRVVGENAEFFKKFLERSSPDHLEKLESLIAEALGTQSYKVMIVPTLTPWRFIPQDIAYHDNGKIFSLKTTYKEYFDALKSEMNDYLAVRVCVIGDRGLLYRNSSKIDRLIKKYLGVK